MRRLKKNHVFFIQVRRGTPCAATSWKFVSDSPGLLDFVIGLVDSDHHLPNGQVRFFWELKLQNYCRAYFFLTSR